MPASPVFRDPYGVVSRPQLEPEVKRAILAAWASDAQAAQSGPASRRPPGSRRPVGNSIGGSLSGQA